jgi:hypothetical protein
MRRLLELFDAIVLGLRQMLPPTTINLHILRFSTIYGTIATTQIEFPKLSTIILAENDTFVTVL